MLLKVRFSDAALEEIVSNTLYSTEFDEINAILKEVLENREKFTRKKLGLYKKKTGIATIASLAYCFSAKEKINKVNRIDGRSFKKFKELSPTLKKRRFSTAICL